MAEHILLHSNSHFSQEIPSVVCDIKLPLLFTLNTIKSTLIDAFKKSHQLLSPSLKGLHFWLVRFVISFLILILSILLHSVVVSWYQDHYAGILARTCTALRNILGFAPVLLFLVLWQLRSVNDTYSDCFLSPIKPVCPRLHLQTALGGMCARGCLCNGAVPSEI